MIKIKKGWIGNFDGEQKDIIVKSAAPNTLKDALIGGGLVLAGVIYLTVSAFKHGVDKHDEAEIQTMKDLGLLKDM